MPDSLEELNLINRNEKNLSQKLLTVLGGITSFGALFPIFYKNFYSITGSNNSYVAFLVFMSIYFITPMITLGLWLYISRGKQLLYNKSTLVRKSTQLFYIFLCVQIVLGSVLISTTTLSAYILYIWAAVYLELIVIMYLTQWELLDRPGRDWHVPALILVVSVVICAITPHYTSNIHRYKSDYEQLNKTEELSRNIRSIEQKTVNVSERFRLLSRMQLDNDNIPAELGKKLEAIVADSISYRYYSIKPYTDFFNALILTREQSGIESFDSFLAMNHLDPHADYRSSLFFNADTMYRKTIVKKWSDSAFTDSLAYINIIGNVISEMLDSNTQLITPSTLSDSIVQTIFAREGIGLQVNDSNKLYFADYLNEYNSVKLYAWVLDFVAYAQRRIQEEVQTTNHNINWIFEDTQMKGLLIFITLVVSMIIYYSIISSLNDAARKNAEKQAMSTIADKNKIIQTLEKRLKLTDHYLFPVTTFIGIIFALLIPLSRPIKPENINTSRPDWFLSLPNWNLSESAIVRNVLPGDINQTPTQPNGTQSAGTSTQPTIAISGMLTNEDLKRAMQPLNDKVDSLDNKIETTITNTNVIRKYINK